MSADYSFLKSSYLLYFFFQAEDGIRDGTVTGVQTCALPISSVHITHADSADVSQLTSGFLYLRNDAAKITGSFVPGTTKLTLTPVTVVQGQIGRASCRERV